MDNDEIIVAAFPFMGDRIIFVSNKGYVHNVTNTAENGWQHELVGVPETVEWIDPDEDT